MQCQREEYSVVIKTQKSLATRCGEAWTSCKNACGDIWRSCAGGCLCCFWIFFWLSLAFLVFGLVWVVIFCQGHADLSLDSINIRNMTLYQNSSIPPSESPWQVDSSFTVNLSASNPNTVAGCFCTFRRVVVRVEYRGQLILQQEVQLDGLGLKPRATRPVSVDVKGEGFQLKNPDLGPFMQNELRNGAMYFVFYFESWYLRNDRKKRSLNFGCLVLAQAPNSTQVIHNNLLTQNCVGY